MWVVRLDAAGDKLWDKSFGGSEDDVLYSLQQTADGGFIFGGYSDSSQGTGNKTSPLYGGNAGDMWVVRLDAAGDKLWDKSLGGSNDDILYALQQTPDGRFILAGYSSSPPGTGNKTCPHYGYGDFWVIRLDADGAMLWDRSFGDGAADTPHSVQQTSDGGFIIGGDLGPGYWTGNRTTPDYGYGDFWAVRLDADGNMLWDEAFGGGYFEHLYSLQQTRDGGFILGGASESAPNTGTKTSPNYGNYDFWVVKISDAGVLVINEGERAGALGEFRDPDPVDIVTITASTGTIDQHGTQSGTWWWSCTPMDGPDTQTVTIVAADILGQISTTSLYMTVRNVAPILKAGPDVVMYRRASGGNFNRTITFTDPGNDHWAGTVNWGDSPASESLTISQTTKSFALIHTYAADGTYTVTVTVNDDDGGTCTGTFIVRVETISPPTISLTSPPPVVGEGEMAVAAGDFSDPDSSDILTVTASIGTVTQTDIHSGAWMWSYTPADGPDSQPITITATDILGDTSTVTFDLLVTNVAPFFDVGLDTFVYVPPAGDGVVSRSIVFTDSGTDVWTGVVNWGDDPTDESLVVNPADKSFGLRHAYTATGMYTVVVTVEDDDGGKCTDIFVVGVGATSPPELSLTTLLSAVGEGSMASASGTFSDPDPEDAVTICTSIGTIEQVGTQSGTWSWSCTPADGPESMLVTICATDSHGVSRMTTFEIVVANVPPVFSAGGDAVICRGPTGAVFSRTITLTDPGSDVWSGTINWGDGTDEHTIIGQMERSLDLRHTYTEDGKYAVALTVNDDDGGTCTGSFVVYVHAATVPGISLSSPQPAIQWQQSFGGTSGDELYCLRQTSDGGFVLGGYSGSSAGTGNKISQRCGSQADFWVVRLDADGSVLWDKSFGGFNVEYLYSPEETTDGGFILGGYSLSDPGMCSKTSPKYGMRDFWVVRLGSDGDKLWDKSFGGSGFEPLYSLQQTSDGGFILGGYSDSAAGSGNKTSPNHGFSDFWVVRLDPEGNTLWDKSFGGSDIEYLYGLQETTDGGFILGGCSFSDPGTGDKTSPRYGSADFWVVRLDTDGNMIWDKSFGGSEYDYLKSLQQTSDGGFILGGCSYSGPGTGDKTSPQYGYGDFWAVRLDADGNKVWDESFGGNDLDELTCLQETMDGGFIVGGRSYSTAGSRMSPYYGGRDFWVVRLNAAGNKLWDMSFGGSDNDDLYSLQQTNDRGFILGGYSRSAPGTGNKESASYGAGDFWVVKLDAGVLTVNEGEEATATGTFWGPVTNPDFSHCS